ncbi:MAG: hypothetical protein CL915_03305 [Deltaproteobacteria bacterium]|nr:hypothetical protein [Deltaproteobacteria bacterium]
MIDFGVQHGRQERVKTFTFGILKPSWSRFGSQVLPEASQSEYLNFPFKHKRSGARHSFCALKESWRKFVLCWLPTWLPSSLSREPVTVTALCLIKLHLSMLLATYKNT